MNGADLSEGSPTLKCRLGLESSAFERSRDKLKQLYLHYYNSYSHHTWQDSNLS